jgi:predicted phage baseplate assembly protein
MALISPILDNRTFEQLYDELVDRIPVYMPEWTNHNESEPAIALLELFAHLGESLLFRFNQIPDTTKLAFLRLLGVQPRPAQPARVLLAATTELAQGVQLLKGTEAPAGSLSFQTDNEVYVWPLDAVGTGKRKAPTDDLTDMEKERRIHATAYPKKITDAVFYETVEVPSDPLAAGAQPLDVSQTLDQSLWIALLRKDTTDIAQLDGRTLFVGIAFDETVPTPFALQDLTPDDTAGFRATGLDPQPDSGLGAELPKMLWQMWNGPSAKEPFTTLSVLGDTTAGLVTTGVVQLELPKVLPRLDPLVTPKGDKDSPPPLNDEKQAELVIGWIQASRPKAARPEDRQDTIHRVRWVGLNAVGATQSRTASAELIGTGTGDSDQVYPLAQHPVLRGTVRLQVEEVDGWHDWREVDDLLLVDGDARAFAVDYAVGLVSFGQRLPQLGQRIRTLSYQYGGGVAGNVAAGAISQAGGVKVTNPLPAVGGSDTVSLKDALDQIPAEVHRHDRAVIADDFRDLAEQLPAVIRAETLPLLHPDTPGIPAAGVISVVIFPAEDLSRPNAPMPDVGLLRRVAKHLDERRLVTTELYVIPPTYKRIAVSVGVSVRKGYQVDAVRRWVELIVRQYLAPVPPFGPEGRGWPLGRTIRRAELEAVAVQVEGVEFIERDLLLGVVTGPEDVPVVTPADSVLFDSWELPALVNITVVGDSPPLPLGTGIQPPDTKGTLVPLPPEVC